MFALIIPDRIRRQYMQKVRRLYEAAFVHEPADLTEQDQVWLEWLSLTNQGTAELNNLICSNVKNAFKARALCVLLAPRKDMVPFAWKGEDIFRDGYLPAGSLPFVIMDSTLHRFVGGLLKLGINATRAFREDEKYQGLLAEYNNLLLELLKKDVWNGAETADLFRYYQINDIMPFSNMDEASGYNPFRNLMFDREVPHGLKIIADRRMREVIESELEDRSAPRRDWEDSFSCYVGHIQLAFYSDVFPYSQELFASQVDFLLTLPSTEGREIFNYYHLGKALSLLEDDGYKELRHRLVRRMMLADNGEHNHFRVNNDETRKVAQMALQEFGAIDTILSETLKSILGQGEAKIAKEKQGLVLHRVRTEGVLDKMR